VDKVTPAERSRIMSRVRSEDTGPEMVVRKLVHRLGYRFRLHDRKLPGQPDLVFRVRRKVIHVHGCFWHQHACARGNRQPSSRRTYWDAKLARNKARDAANAEKLAAMGWQSLVIWECELGDTEALTRRVEKFLS
jgi:DNA mismatch endonuclease (patch repair protein)